MADERFYDQRVTYTQGGRGFSADPREVLMAAARMERDGWSLAKIRQELSLGSWVTDQQLRNALVRGHQFLNEAIARGEVPEESVIDTEKLLQEEEVTVNDEEVLKKMRPPIWTPGGEV